MAANNVYRARDAKLEYQPEGSTDWVEVQGVQSISLSGGQPDSEDITTFAGTTTIVGSPSGPTVECGVLANPLHRSWQDLIDYASAGKSTTFRIVTKGSGDLFTASGSSNTVAIATSGRVTFAGTGPDFSTNKYAPGNVISYSSTNHVIEKIEKSGSNYTVDVHPAPNPAVGATQNYKVRQPDVRRGPFTGAVSAAGLDSLDSGGQLQTTLTIQANAPIGKAVIHT